MKSRTLLTRFILLFLLCSFIPSSSVDADSPSPYLITQTNSIVAPEFLLKASNRLYFKPGGEVNYWLTDGLPENTSVIPGASFCTLSDWSQHSDGFPAALGNVAYYPGPDCELWRSDGTASGTLRLSQGAFPVNTPISAIVAETPLNNNKLIFLTGDNVFVDWSQYYLWSSDGSPAGTKKLLSLGETGASMNYVTPVAFKDAVYFFTIYASNTDPNSQWTKFWRTDGTVLGTRAIFDSRTFQNFTGKPGKLVASGSHLFFESYPSLWQSDGTLSGTKVVSKCTNSKITDMVDVNGTLFLIYRNNFDLSGVLYKTNGAEFGGLKTVYIFPQPISNLDNLSATASGNHIFFLNRVGDGSPDRLWVSDGTNNGTHPVMINNGLTFPGSSLVSLGDRVAFIGYQEHDDDDEIWFSDGTEVGSYPITNFDNGSYEKLFSTMTFVGGRLLFFFKDGQNGYDLWGYDYLHERFYLPLINR